MLVLDFDLDFIVRPIRRAAPDKRSRYEGPEVSVWREGDFRSYLEGSLQLSLGGRVPGRACEHHKEVFFHAKSLIEGGTLVPPLHWVHVDAHDDIVGCSDKGDVSSADFLLHMVGQDWLAHIDFVLPDGEAAERVCLMRWDPLRIEFGSHRCTVGFPDEGGFRLKNRPDFVFLTRSPDFTPQAADPLFDLARGYIREG